MNTLSEGREKLKALAKEASTNCDKNEAQTRFHLIDTVLFECLGWGKADVEVEKYERSQFTDYELGKPRSAILEAKREGEVFDVPAGVSAKLTTDIPSLMAVSQAASEAIQQAQDYCSKRGVPIAVVSNGHQYILFLASRQDGISVLDGKAVVFTSLEHMVENFDIAWQLMSQSGILEKRLNRYLLTDKIGIPNKLSSKLTQYPVVRYASETQATLRQLSELFFQDILENDAVEERFFAECYCESGALSKYALLSKNVLEARYSALFSESESAPHTVPVREKKNDNFSPDVLAESVTKRPIVLLGDVGVGKTSFVKNLMYNSAYEEFRNAIYIYIDLGSNAALSSNLKTFILNEIESQLIDKYDIDPNSFDFLKGVYASDIYRFSASIWGQKREKNPDLYEEKLLLMLEEKLKQKDQHLKHAINFHSKSSRKQIIVSIDNADQREYEVQQEAFVIAQEISNDWNSTVFIAVRPQTFFKSKRAGSLSAYPHKVFTISPPRIDSVISKRLDFALKMAEGRMPIETVNYVKLNAKNLALFLKALISSLAKNPDLYEFLTNITGGNIRSAIEFVTSFIGSPNVDAEKIIDIMSTRGKYKIPLHEFTKSALLGDYSHYNPDTSVAMNVFDVRSPSPNDHFLVPIVLAFLDKPGPHRNNDAFCTSEEIFEEMQNFGFIEDSIASALRRMTNRKLIETSQRITFEEDQNGILIGAMPSMFRVTSIGAYHLLRWINVFTYLDAMVFDTPVFDEAFRIDVSADINSLGIKDRYHRATCFRRYLIECWENLPNKPTYFNFIDLLDDGNSTFESVDRVIQRNGIVES